jgi:hypothetical protein
VRIVELSPHPVALYSVQRTRSAALATCTGTCRPARGTEDLAAGLWCDGFDVDWAAVGKRVTCPVGALSRGPPGYRLSPQPLWIIVWNAQVPSLRTSMSA